MNHIREKIGSGPRWNPPDTSPIMHQRSNLVKASYRRVLGKDIQHAVLPSDMFGKIGHIGSGFTFQLKVSSQQIQVQEKQVFPAAAPLSPI